MKRSRRKSREKGVSTRGSSVYLHRFDPCRRNADNDWVVLLPGVECALGCAARSGLDAYGPKSGSPETEDRRAVLPFFIAINHSALCKTDTTSWILQIRYFDRSFRRERGVEFRSIVEFGRIKTSVFSMIVTECKDCDNTMGELCGKRANSGGKTSMRVSE